MIALLLALSAASVSAVAASRADIQTYLQSVYALSNFNNMTDAGERSMMRTHTPPLIRQK
jgi:hypothetical protein